MKYFISLLLVFVFIFNAFSQDKKKGWNEFKVGMSIDDAKILLQKRCKEIVEDELLTGYNCGIYFNKQLQISLHKKYKYLIFVPYVSTVILSIDTQDKSDTINVFNHLKKKYKTNEDYYSTECIGNKICIWDFDDYNDVQLWLDRGILDNSTYTISIVYKDILNHR